MKKLTTIIAMMLLMVQASFAQSPTETHWKPDTHKYPTNATLTSAIYIDEDFQDNPYLELGAFCDDELRGAVLPLLFPPTQQYVWSLMVYGNNDDVITFKVYDHENGEEIELSCETTYTFQVDDIVGNAFTPYVVNFASNTVTINATATPEEGGTIDGAGIYHIDDDVNLTAIANDGYAFVNWTENNEEVSKSSDYEFTATEDRDLVANFIEKHWIEDPSLYENSVNAFFSIYIDDVEQQNGNLELGAFCGDELRGSGMAMYFPITNKYIWNFHIYGNDNDQITFKLYDHSNAEEVNVLCSTTYTFNSEDEELGNGFDPYQVDFTRYATITVAADPEEGGETTGGGSYQLGTEATVTATPSIGYEFVNWTEGENVVSTNAEYTFTATNARDLVAHFALINYTLTINYAGAGDDTPEQFVETLTYGAAYSVASPTIDCYDIDKPLVEGTMPAEDLTIDVTYTIKTHTLTIYYTGAGDLTPEQYTETVNCGGEYEVPTPDVQGYTPDIFVVEGTMQDEDLNFTVTYTANGYQIEVEASPEDGGTVSGSGTYGYNAEVTIVATPSDNYNFINWTFDGEEVSTEPSYTFNVDDDMLFTANFELKTYTVTVTADPEEGGTVTGGGAYNHGETAEITAEANDTYTFLLWTVNGEPVSNQTTYSFTVTSNVEVVARFSQIKYNITATANPSEGGSVTGASSYILNSEATLTASPNEGYVFVNWTDNYKEVSKDATYTFAVTGPRNLVANFSPCQTITLKQGQNYFSTYIEVSGVSGMKKLQAALGTKAKSIKSKTKTTTYYAGYGWYGTLKEINNKEMYIITMKQAATITLVGDIVDPTTQEIVIMKGTNYIGYPCTTDNQSLASALANMTPTKGDIIKSQTQSAVYNNGKWSGTLKAFNVGKGYIYTSKKAQSYGFYFPANNNKAEIAYNEETHWTPVNYNGAMTIYGVLQFDEVNYTADDRYEIGAFVNGECRGATIADYDDGKYYYSLNIFGDTNGDEVYFDLYDRQEEKECDKICEETISFEVDGTIGDSESNDWHAINFVDGAMITVSANPTIGGTVTGGGRYAANANVTVTAQANTDYEFVNWTENNDEQTTNTSYEFIASTRRNLVANFTKTSSSYEIVTSVGGTTPTHATITADVSSATAGQTITVSTTWDPGYILLGLKYYETGTDPEVTGVEIDDNQNQFTMPPYDVTITAECYLDETEYTVTTAQGIVNGTISSDKESGIYNTEVTITATPDYSGFLEGLYYIKANSSDHINIDLETMKFNMPQANVTVHAQFALRGDSNADNVVNILDVVNTARKVLGQEPEHFKFTCADVNQDNIIDVNDITGTANVAVNRGIGECYDYEGGYYIENGMLNIETNVAVAGIQVELDAETASFANLEGFTTGSAWVDGSYVMLAYSIDNVIEAGTHQIMQVGRANIKRIIVSTAEGCNVSMSYGHLGVAENDNDNIQIYPNPAKSYVRINGNGIEKVTITNIMGQVVLDNEVCSDNEVIDISSFCNGAYLFRVVTAYGTFTKNVVITK